MILISFDVGAETQGLRHDSADVFTDTGRDNAAHHRPIVAAEVGSFLRQFPSNDLNFGSESAAISGLRVRCALLLVYFTCLS